MPNYQISRKVVQGAELLHVDKQTDRYEANSRISQFEECA
jgi:hypothetical protein